MGLPGRLESSFTMLIPGQDTQGCTQFHSSTQLECRWMHCSCYVSSMMGGFRVLRWSIKGVQRVD